MWKRYLWVKNLLFLCLFSYLTARIGNTILLAHLPPPPPEPSSLRRPAFAARRGHAVKGLRHYRPIVQKNIFNSSASGAGTGEKSRTVATTAPVKKTELNVELIGTVVGSGGDSFAIIEDKKTRKQELYQVDDVIQDEARILAISRCRVILLRQGSEEVIECVEPQERKTKGPRVRYSGGSSEQGGFSVKKVSENEYVIDEREVQNALNNINQLLTQIRVVPNFTDGKPDGFKVFAIRPNSIFAKIGLKNGDVIREINGRDITSPDKAFQAFQELKDESNLSVEISRRGQRRTLNYEIR